MTNQSKNQIPEGWRKRKVGDISDVKGGYAFSSKRMKTSQSEYQVVKMGNIYNGQLDLTRNPSFIECIAKKESDYLLEENDILTSLTGTIGKRDYGYIVKINNPIPLLLNQRLARFRAIEEEVLPSFLFSILKHPYFQNQFFDISEGGTGNQSNVSLQKLKGIPLLLPPLPEQKRIVSVLETWDKYLELLDKKIKVKKLIKKGLMQRLLSGELRLPGFSGEWKRYQLVDILEYEQPTKYIVSSTKYCDEFETPVLTAGKTFVLGYTNETTGIFPKDKLPVIIFDDFTTANKFVDFPFKVKSSAMKMLRSKDDAKFNIRVIFESIQLLRFQTGEHKRQYLSEYQYLDVILPSIDEQSAIADILSSADEEIRVLEEKRKIIAEQKKFLLNNLITGKIRVP